MIPKEKDWKNYQDDLDTNWAFKKFFGKSISEAKKAFFDSPLERSFDLTYMAEIPFRYYMIAFRDYVQERNFPYMDCGSSYCAYVDTILVMLNDNPEHILPILGDVLPLAEEIAEKQEEYEISENIFGNYASKIAEAKSKI